jgi:hypothetical protein
MSAEKIRKEAKTTKRTGTSRRAASPKSTLTREQMLKKIGLKDEDFRDYLKKHTEFLNSLNVSQKKFHFKNRPKKKVKEIAKSLGPNCTSEHIMLLFEEAPPVLGISPIGCCR